MTGDTTNPSGTFSLAGTTDLTIIGRSGPFQLGTFAIDATLENYVGSFFGQTVGLSLDPAGVHDATTIVELAVQNGNTFKGYLIGTTLNLTHQISVNHGPPISIGTAHAGVNVVPEPSAFPLLGLPLSALLWIRRQREMLPLRRTPR